MTSRKAWQSVNQLYLVLEKNNLLDNELRNYIWDLEDYIKICESEEESKEIIFKIREELEDFTRIINDLIDLI